MEEIINKSIEYISNLYTKADTSKLIFHNLEHSLEVQNNIIELGVNSGLTAKEILLLRLAAIFHDTGWIENKEDHESHSVLIAEKFLANNGVPDNDIKIISDLIKITNITLTPNTLLEKVIRDADILHVGRKGFNKKSQLLRSEKELNLNRYYNDKQWLEKNINFLETNHFFTDYAKQQYQSKKEKNILKLKSKKEEIMKDFDSADNSTLIKNDDKKKEKKKDSGRGVETMFRNTIRTHVEFSSMADSKANIMISVNTLLLTAVAAFLVKSLDTNPHLILPTAILVAVSLSTLIFAISVTKPKITAGTFTREDVQKRRVNLMFFGNFCKMDINSFEWGMNELINDSEFLYSNMIRDYYNLGIVLGEKYRKLRICYSIFMYGIIVCVIAFALAIFFSTQQTVMVH